MKKLISIILACILLVTVFSGCNKIGGSQKTIFIYMCGSNLETKQGLAGKNIDEILQADIGRDMNVVIETGGAQTWRSHGIDNSARRNIRAKRICWSFGTTAAARQRAFALMKIIPLIPYR